MTHLANDIEEVVDRLLDSDDPSKRAAGRLIDCRIIETLDDWLNVEYHRGTESHEAMMGVILVMGWAIALSATATGHTDMEELIGLISRVVEGHLTDYHTHATGHEIN